MILPNKLQRALIFFATVLSNWNEVGISGPLGGFEVVQIQDMAKQQPFLKASGACWNGNSGLSGAPTGVQHDGIRDEAT